MFSKITRVLPAARHIYVAPYLRLASSKKPEIGKKDAKGDTVPASDDEYLFTNFNSMTVGQKLSYLHAVSSSGSALHTKIPVIKSFSNEEFNKI